MHKNALASTKQRTLTLVLFAIYALVLVWAILFKLQLSFAGIVGERECNLIPFRGSFNANGAVLWGDIISNILVFIPLGIYICMLRSDWPFVKKLLPILGVTFAFEIAQYSFAIGRTDSTDILCNALGGVIGIGFYALLRKLLQHRANGILNLCALALTVCALALIAWMLAMGRYTFRPRDAGRLAEPSAYYASEEAVNYD